ncbi:hypothetical protein CGCSCA4_v011268 [Colletotrichum siamense]|uniref:CorA-like Mg2+ transporter n=2 Tax=Colletotrichum gloeosporioides species complex TaxID=2707338 RepID=A0A9P5K277_COLSI|nr:hypothetical protein CGCSCA4_v011268 [Colletotrichum siamense]KAF4853236.1 hypothetical protein CGCSCA2_v010055 [Colletotrichum siamense]
MDWVRKNPQMGIRDLETFEYQPQQCQILRVVNGNAKKGIEARQVRTEDEWKNVFRQVRLKMLHNCNDVTRLAARAAENKTDGKDYHDPSILSKLPFTEATWSHMLEIFHIHGSVARLINRGLSCVFSRSFLTQDISSEPIVVYNCRSPASWPGDLAMSMTWFPERNFCQSSDINEFRKLMRDTGDRIKERLQDIIREYDERIRDCERNLEGMSLANQMAHTKANMEIASRTKSDSTQMKSIALLTMVFLPATFLATVFSMSFFNWQPESEKGETEVSPRIWIYVVMATGVTILTVLAWLWFIKGRRSWKQRRQSVDEYELSDSQV